MPTTLVRGYNAIGPDLSANSRKLITVNVAGDDLSVIVHFARDEDDITEVTHIMLGEKLWDAYEVLSNEFRQQIRDAALAMDWN